MRRILIVLGVVVCAGSLQAADLDLTPFQKELQFNFGNPGARALGMGGAFLGRADDASAAEANPAGLTVISKRELTVEFRNTTGSFLFPTGARASTSTTPGSIILGDIPAKGTNNVTFASFAMPIGPVAVAAYYHVPLDFSTERNLTDPVTSTVAGAPSVGQVLIYPGRFSAAYKSKVIGLAAAWRIGQFSLGASAKKSSISITSNGQTFSNFSVANTLRDSATLRASESKTSYNVGLLWTSRTEALTLGAVYKKGATFNATESRTVCSPNVLPAIGNVSTDLSAAFTCPGSPNVSFLSPFQIPDRYGVGMSIRFKSGFTLNEDIVRVKYSSQIEGFRSTIYCDAFAAAGYTDATGGPNPFCTAAALSGKQLGYTIPDATEVHLGGEYRLPRSNIALRAGAWSSPPHQVDIAPATGVSIPAMTCKFKNSAGVSQCQPTSQVFGSASGQASIFFSDVNAQRQVHVTAGIGYLARSFEINAGYDHSSRSKTASFQLLTRF